MNEWTLIVLIAGLLPPQGFVQYGFDSKKACEDEAQSYCPVGDKHPQFKCKCEKGMTPPGVMPPPVPPLKKGKP